MNNHFQITFSTGNAAFEDDVFHETATILRTISERVANGDIAGGLVKDTNGNTIGQCGIS